MNTFLAALALGILTAFALVGAAWLASSVMDWLAGDEY